MPFIEINDKKIEAEAGSMIIEVADSHDIQIPRFCYHKKLSIAANCRMCLVEVEKAPKALPACATPITDGMKVWTHSPKALLAQKYVMEFLLINHPLDCPICDQGGECELQDISMGFGTDASRFTEGKRTVKDKDIGPLIATDMTRCIHCTRCVRFGTEVAGLRELGATFRGENMEIGTFIEKSVISEVSGNVIDLCPVGALTSKPFRFTARAWELKQTASVAAHDCIGSNLYIHTRRDQVMRVVPKENEQINEMWISDRDRFSYEALNHSDRLAVPKIKKHGKWQTVSWSEALEFTAAGLLSIIEQQGPEAIGGLISPNSTLEECYLFQKWLRELGTNNIDHRLRQNDFRRDNEEVLFPNSGMVLSEIEKQSSILVVGANIRKEQPLLALKCRKASLAGGQIFVVNPVDFPMNFELAGKSIVERGDLVSGLAKIVKAMLTLRQNDKNSEAPPLPLGAEQLLQDFNPSENDIAMAKGFLQGENKWIMLGALAQSHPDYSILISLAKLITEFTDVQYGLITDGANASGAWLTGCVPHRNSWGVAYNESKFRGAKTEGLTAKQMFEQPLGAYVLFNCEPDLDFSNGVKAIQALQNANLTILITPFSSPAMESVADVLLPMTVFTETSGTLVNIHGDWQSLAPVSMPFADSRPGWKILRVLGNLCNLAGFEETSSADVRASFSDQMDPKMKLDKPWICPAAIEPFQEKAKLIRIAPIPLYASDGLVRRAKSLQAMPDAGQAVIYLNRDVAKRCKLTIEDTSEIAQTHEARISCNGFSLTLPYIIDDTLPNGAVVLAGALAKTVALGEAYAEVEVTAI